MLERGRANLDEEEEVQEEVTWRTGDQGMSSQRLHLTDSTSQPNLLP